MLDAGERGEGCRPRLLEPGKAWPPATFYPVRSDLVPIKLRALEARKDASGERSLLHERSVGPGATPDTLHRQSLVTLDLLSLGFQRRAFGHDPLLGVAPQCDEQLAG